MRWVSRINQSAKRLLLLPVAVISRQTAEGFRFLFLAALCGFLSAVGSSNWSNIPLLMCLMLLSLWLLAMWRGSRSLKRIDFRRTHVERAFANESISVGLTVANAGNWPCAGVIVSEVLESDDEPAGGKEHDDARVHVRVPVAHAGAFVTVVPGRSAERVKYSIAVRRRGIYRFGKTTLETEFPMGFFRSSAPRQVPGRLIVYPRFGEVDTSFFKELDLSLEFIRRQKPSRAEEDFRGLREYRQGDNPKWIHWRSSARVQKVLVKEFEEPQARRVMIVLDTNLQRMGVQRFPAFETAISFAATLARDLARRGCEVECVGLQPKDRVARITISRERRNLDSLLEMLAGIKRDDRRTLAHLSDFVSRRSLHRVFILVIGLGSLRSKTNLAWMNTADNAVKVIDVRGDEFRRAYSRVVPGAARGESLEEEMLLDVDEEGAEEEAALGAGAAGQ